MLVVTEEGEEAVKVDQTKMVFLTTFLLLVASTMTVVMLRILTKNAGTLEQTGPGAIHNLHIRELLATVACAFFIELIAVEPVFVILNWVVSLFTGFVAIALAVKKCTAYRRSTQRTNTDKQEDVEAEQGTGSDSARKQGGIGFPPKADNSPHQPYIELQSGSHYMHL